MQYEYENVKTMRRDGPVSDPALVNTSAPGACNPVRCEIQPRTASTPGWLAAGRVMLQQ